MAFYDTAYGLLSFLFAAPWTKSIFSFYFRHRTQKFLSVFDGFTTRHCCTKIIWANCKREEKENWNCKQFRIRKLFYDLRGLGTWKESFRLFKSFKFQYRRNPSKPKTDESQSGERAKRHINTTQIILIKIIWRTFFEGGLFFGSGRPCAGLCFGKNGKIEDPFSESGVIESLLFHHIHSELFSLKDLNARHFIWPEFSLSLTPLCLEKFLLYPNSIQNSPFFVFEDCTSVVCWGNPGIPPIIQPKISNEMHRKKGFRSQKNISFRHTNT